MPQVEKTALVLYSAEQMYALVNDVCAYPEFIDDCQDAKLLESGDSHLRASLQISKGFMSQWFTTENTMVSGREIQISLVDGPFKSLSGSWHFLPLSEEACKIIFHLDFAFSNKIIEGAFGRVFSAVTSNMVDAFTKRARVVYGEPTFD